MAILQTQKTGLTQVFIDIKYGLCLLLNMRLQTLRKLSNSPRQNTPKDINLSIPVRFARWRM